MDSLKDLLAGKAPVEPPEIELIKHYVFSEFGSKAEVMVRERDIVISVANAALAGTLRLRSPAIKQLCHTDKRLIFRIN